MFGARELVAAEEQNFKDFLKSVRFTARPWSNRWQLANWPTPTPSCATAPPQPPSPIRSTVILRAISVLASLRLTVVLFALSIFLVFVGTLAQKDHDVWAVVNDMYFRVWWAFVDFQTFERLAQMFFKTIDWNLTGGFYFPGGKLIGSALLINLFAAHAVRFKVAASGIRLAVGLAVIALGILLTSLVIYNGMGQAVVSELSRPFSPNSGTCCVLRSPESPLPALTSSSWASATAARPCGICCWESISRSARWPCGSCSTAISASTTPDFAFSGR